MAARIPILLSYYALSNGKQALVFGQIVRMRTNDLSFIDYSRRRTFRTLLSLYRTHAVSGTEIRLTYGTLEVITKTDTSGFFLATVTCESIKGVLERIVLSNGSHVNLMRGQYSLAPHEVNTNRIVVSDIDDTILHSYIKRKILKFRTLMFTPVEKRKAVEPVKALIQSIVNGGASAIYLSNSEQNLYPLIYRFLIHHGFPPGPLFLKQMRKLRDVMRYRKLPSPEVHKIKMMDYIIPLFRDRKFSLVGDNTQFDMAIYVSTAKKYPDCVSDIFIRRVNSLPNEKIVIEELREMLKTLNVVFHYGESFEK